VLTWPADPAARDHEHITGFQPTDELGQFGPVCLRARDLLLEDLRAAERLEPPSPDRGCSPSRSRKSPERPVLKATYE
jgi:hypothetical protein